MGSMQLNARIFFLSTVMIKITTRFHAIPSRRIGCRRHTSMQLAEQGVRFERTYLGAWCMPSRASFLTGRLQHGVQSMRMEGDYPGSTYDPKQCQFWPSVLKANGYHTAQIGKWHTGVDTGNGRDWNHQIVWNRPAHPDNAGHYFYDQIVTFNGKDRRVEGYSTDNYTDWAIDYIEGENRDSDKPWYLWLCYGAIHGPTTPAERHEGGLKGKEADVPVDIFGPWPEKPQYLEKTSSWQKGPDGKAYRRKKKLKKVTSIRIQQASSTKTGCNSTTNASWQLMKELAVW